MIIFTLKILIYYMSIKEKYGYYVSNFKGIAFKIVSE